mgnify:CR=1 FL=1
MPVNLDWLSQIAQPVKPVDPLQMQMQQIALQNAQLQQQEALQTIKDRQEKDTDLAAMDQLWASLQPNHDGSISNESMNAVLSHTPARYLTQIRTMIDAHNKAVDDNRKRDQAYKDATDAANRTHLMDQLYNLATTPDGPEKTNAVVMQAAAAVKMGWATPDQVQPIVNAAKQGGPALQQALLGAMDSATLDRMNKYKTFTTPEKQTFGEPKAFLVDGKPQILRSRSDGRMVDINGNVVTGKLEEAPAQMTPYQQQMLALAWQKWNEEQRPFDIGPDTKTTTSGQQYFDPSLYRGNERNKAIDAAKNAGITVVTPNEAADLTEIDAARLNQDAIWNSISSKLVKAAQDRPLAAAKTALERFFQTEDEKAAFDSWRSAAIKTLRATAGSKGLRINKDEIRLALENDIPKLSDTWGVAKTKIDHINTLLDNAEKSITVKNRSGLRINAPSPFAQTTPTVTPGSGTPQALAIGLPPPPDQSGNWKWNATTKTWEPK